MCFQVLPDWRGIHDAAIGPQGVDTPIQTERCVRTHIAVVHFAVVTHQFYNLVTEVVRQAKLAPMSPSVPSRR